METKVFISYRREDTEASAGRLYDAMILKYSPESIFKDIDSIPLGSDFKETIESKIQDCNIVLAIIGKNFTKLKDEKGVPRIFNREDFVNMELYTAFKEGKIVIPVFVDNAVIPKVSELPDNLHKLPFLNGIRLRHDSWNRDTEKLFNAISKIIDSIEEKKEAERKKKQDEEAAKQHEKEELERKQKEEQQRRQREKEEAERKAAIQAAQEKAETTLWLKTEEHNTIAEFKHYLEKYPKIK